MLIIILIIMSIVVLATSIYFSFKRIREKAMNVKLNVSQNEMTKLNDDLKKDQIIKEKNDVSFISEDRINIIKEKFKSTQNMKIIEKEVTKDDVDNFYKSQVDNKDLNKKLEK